MSHRCLIVLAIFAGLPGVAGAQFTTFIPPHNTALDSVKAVVVAQTKTRADSAVHVQLTNMKTWVDSAAGVTPVATTPAGSLTNVATTTTASTTTMRSGRRAPATASPLPLIVLLGALSVGLGVTVLAASQGARDRA